LNKKQIAFTGLSGLGAELIHIGVYLSIIMKFIEYERIQNEKTRAAMLSLTALSTFVMVGLTRVIALWEDYSADNFSLYMVQNDSESTTFTRAAHALIASNISFINVFFGFLSANILLGFIEADIFTVALCLGAFITVSDSLSYFAFVLRAAVNNIKFTQALVSSYYAGDNEFNASSAVKSIIMCTLTVIAYTIFMNFAMQNALAIFPVIGAGTNNLFKEIVAGIAAITYSPALISMFMLQSYRFFEGMDREVTLQPNQSLLAKAGYALFALISGAYLSMLGAVAYISTIGVVVQFGGDPISLVTQILSALPALSIMCSEYMFTARSAETNVIKWANETSSGYNSQRVGRSSTASSVGVALDQLTNGGWAALWQDTEEGTDSRRGGSLVAEQHQADTVANPVVAEQLVAKV
jgi:hypothetical protein